MAYFGHVFSITFLAAKLMKLDVFIEWSIQGNSVAQVPVCSKSLCDASKRFWECYTVTPPAHDCTHSQNLLDASQSDFEHTGA
jgi:hypothetical protein